jgi:Phosphotransferase enzyme family
LREHVVDVALIDALGVTNDPAMSSLAAALDPAEVRRRFRGRLRRVTGENGLPRLRTIRVTRYKPGRRCVIEYDLEVERPDAAPEMVTLIGKVRRLRSGKSGYRLLSALWEAGFGADSADGITVAEPIGVVPEFRLWLQRKVQGQVATDLLAAPGGEDLVRRIAEAAHKVHRAGVLAKRRHTMNDELRILHERLPSVARSEPRWAGRIQRLLDACDRLGAGTLEPEPCGIHRDFYADQVIVAGPRLCLIDFDLYCEGDPALDIGNFLGHIREQSLRSLGDPEALADLEVAMEERFVELAGEQTRPAVRAYKLLTLARHVHLSTLFPERRPFTGNLLELCEEYLGARC